MHLVVKLNEELADIYIMGQRNCILSKTGLFQVYKHPLKSILKHCMLIDDLDH